MSMQTHSQLKKKRENLCLKTQRATYKTVPVSGIFDGICFFSTELGKFSVGRWESRVVLNEETRSKPKSDCSRGKLLVNLFHPSSCILS